MKIQNIIICILIIISMIVVLWYIFSSSPTFEQAILILIITFLFKIQSDMTSNKIEIKTLKKKFDIMEDGLVRLIKDFKQSSNNIKEHIKKI